MNINIKATNIELTTALSEHVHKRLGGLQKFLEDGVHVYVEIGKTTNHHKHGDVYKAEIDIKNNGGKFFALAETNDLYKAVDMATEEIVRELTTDKDKVDTLYRRGARSVKKMLKGLSARNPFTSK